MAKDDDKKTTPTEPQTPAVNTTKPDEGIEQIKSDRDDDLRTVPQQQVDQYGNVTNRPGTDENGTAPLDAPIDSVEAARLRGEDTGSDVNDDGTEVKVGGTTHKVEKVENHPYSGNEVYKSEDGHFFRVRGGSVEQTFSPGTPEYRQFVNTLSEQDQRESGDAIAPDVQAAVREKAAEAEAQKIVDKG